MTLVMESVDEHLIDGQSLGTTADKLRVAIATLPNLDEARAVMEVVEAAHTAWRDCRCDDVCQHGIKMGTAVQKLDAIRKANANPSK